MDGAAAWRVMEVYIQSSQGYSGIMKRCDGVVPRESGSTCVSKGTVASSES